MSRTQTAKDIIRQCLFKGAIELLASPTFRKSDYEVVDVRKFINEFISDMEEDLFSIKGENGINIKDSNVVGTNINLGVK